MTTSRSLDGLRRSTDKRKAATRSKIKKALRDMQRKGLTINVNAVAKYAGVARKTIYNHQSLLDDIRAAGTAPTPRLAEPTTPGAQSSIVAALREQLRAQKQRYESEIADLKTKVKKVERELAAAHGEIHRLGKTGNSRAAQRR